MGRVFNKLRKQVNDRRAERERFINYGARLAKLEEYLYELGSYQMSLIPNGEDITQSGRDIDILAAHEEYRHFLEKVTKQNG